MNNQELKLHISTPLGVMYDDFVSLVVLKVRDGYRGVNKRQFLSIQKINLGKIKIYGLNELSPKTFLISEGLVKIDQYECKIYCQFLINPEDVENNQYIIAQHQLQSLLDETLEKEILIKKEIDLRKAIAHLKK